MQRLEMLGGDRVRWVDAPDPLAERGEVVVRIARSALCGSELHSYHGSGITGSNAVHEAAGTGAYAIATYPGPSHIIKGEEVVLTDGDQAYTLLLNPGAGGSASGCSWRCAAGCWRCWRSRRRG